MNKSEKIIEEKEHGDVTVALLQLSKEFLF